MLTPPQPLRTQADPTCSVLLGSSPWAWWLPAPPARTNVVIHPWPAPASSSSSSPSSSSLRSSSSLDTRPNELVLFFLLASAILGGVLSVLSDVSPAIQAFVLESFWPSPDNANSHNTAPSSSAASVAPMPASQPSSTKNQTESKTNHLLLPIHQPTVSWLLTAPVLRVHAVEAPPLSWRVRSALFPSGSSPSLGGLRSLGLYYVPHQHWLAPTSWSTLAGLSLPMSLLLSLLISVVLSLGYVTVVRRTLWALVFQVVGPSVVPSFRRTLWDGAYTGFSLTPVVFSAWSTPGFTLVLAQLGWCTAWCVTRVLWITFISHPMPACNAIYPPGPPLKPTLQALPSSTAQKELGPSPPPGQGGQLDQGIRRSISTTTPSYPYPYASFALASLAGGVSTQQSQRQAIYDDLPPTSPSVTTTTTAAQSSWALARAGCTYELAAFTSRLNAMVEGGVPTTSVPAAATAFPGGSTTAGTTTSSLGTKSAVATTATAPPIPAPPTTTTTTPGSVESVWDKLAHDTAKGPRNRLFAPPAPAAPEPSYAFPRMHPPPTTTLSSRPIIDPNTPRAQSEWVQVKAYALSYAVQASRYGTHWGSQLAGKVYHWVYPHLSPTLQGYVRSALQAVEQANQAATCLSPALLDRVLIGGESGAGEHAGSGAGAAWAAQALCALLVHSTSQDPYGMVGRDVPSVLECLTTALEATCDLSSVLPAAVGGAVTATDAQEDWVVVRTVLAASVREILRTFAPFRKELAWGDRGDEADRIWEHAQLVLDRNQVRAW